MSKSFILLIVILVCFSCVPEEKYKLADIDGEFAIALVDSDITIVDLAEASEQENLEIRVDEEDRITLFYKGDVVEQVSTQIFPPFPYGLYTDITENFSPIDFPVPEGRTVDIAVFDGTKLVFEFESSFLQDVNVSLEFPEIKKDGETWKMDFFIDYQGEPNTFYRSDTIDITDWAINTEDNFLSSNYTAILEDGTSVTLDRVAFWLDFFDFDYVQGFFGGSSAPLVGDVITIDVFNKWLSGGLTFDDPKFNFQVENSFGFPVRMLVNEIVITTISGNQFQLEGEAVDEGVAFNFPSLDEVGEIALTDFNYDNSNTNIGELFNEKAASVFYDVIGVANSESDPMVIGFLTDDSYYKIKVAVELPLLCKLNDLKLTDTFDIDLTEFDDFKSAEFKMITQNSFPFNVELEIDMLDDNGNTLAKLLPDGSVFLTSGNLRADGGVDPLDPLTTLVPIEDDLVDAVKNTKKIAVISTFSNSEIAPDESFWIRSSYGIDFKLGIKVNNEGN